MRRATLSVMLVALGAMVAPSAMAQSEPLDLRQHYSGISSVPVIHIETYNTYSNGSGTANSFSFGSGLFSFDDPFLKSSANPPLYTMFAGVWTDSGSSALSDARVAFVAGPVNHLVLALTSSYAAGLVSGGEDFSMIFPTFNEDSLIQDLINIDGSADEATASISQAELVNFYGEIRDRGGLTPAFGGPLSLIAFSSAQTVGMGVADVTPQAGAVPEPSTWLMLIIGFGMLGCGMRRRPKSETQKVNLT